MELWIGILTAVIILIMGSLYRIRFPNKMGSIIKPVLAVCLLTLMLVSQFLTGCMEKEPPRQQSQGPDTLTVHFIDVGQADSILVVNGQHAMLIDAGNNADAAQIEDYLRKEGISELEFLVGTHPHEDHVGGLDVIIQDFDVFKVIMPRVNHDTQSYKDVLLSMVARMMQPVYPAPGSSYELGSAEFTVLSPGRRSYEELNDYSIVIKLVFGDTSFLFTGDAGFIPEQEMIAQGYDLSADVLKIGHHGSRYSTSDDFLRRVNPEAVVISVGKNNDYQHPHAETMLKLEANEIPVYRTDENGTVLAVSDGHTIRFNTDPGTYAWPQDEKPDRDTAEDVSDDADLPMVYVTESGDKYHLETCRFLNENKLAISREEAIEKGYKPCLLCKP